jgi:hypothetical protein
MKMGIFLWVLCGIATYFTIGLIMALVFIKRQGMSLDKIDTGEDIALPIFMWPLFAIFGIGYLIVLGVRKLFNLLAIYVFKVPQTDPDTVHADDGGGMFIHGTTVKDGSNPPPTTPKPEGVIPPSQKAMHVEQIPRTDLIDID